MVNAEVSRERAAEDNWIVTPKNLQAEGTENVQKLPGTGNQSREEKRVEVFRLN